MESRVERVVLETAHHRIVGDLTMPREGYRSRLSDFLNRGDLDFIPLAWEPFDLAMPADSLPRAEPLLAGLAGTAVARRAAELGGYDLEGSGAVTPAG